MATLCATVPPIFLNIHNSPKPPTHPRSVVASFNLHTSAKRTLSNMQTLFIHTHIYTYTYTHVCNVCIIYAHIYKRVSIHGTLQPPPAAALCTARCPRWSPTASPGLGSAERWSHGSRRWRGERAAGAPGCGGAGDGAGPRGLEGEEYWFGNSIIGDYRAPVKFESTVKDEEFA